MGLSVLDAGPVIAVLDAADAHHAAAVAVLERAEVAGDRFVMPASAYAECLVSPSRRGSAAVNSVDDYLDALSAFVEPATREVARVAAGLRARHGRRLPLPDALVVATAIVLKADRILTTDAGWPRRAVAIEVIGV